MKRKYTTQNICAYKPLKTFNLNALNEELQFISTEVCTLKNNPNPSGGNTSALGEIYNKTSFTSGDLISDFNNNGSTVSVVGAGLQFSGGANTSDQSLDFHLPTNLQYYRISMEVTVGTKNGTSYGFGAGIRSINPVTNGTMYSKFDMSTGGSSGKTSFSIGGTVSDTAISFTVGDKILFTFEQNLDEYIVTATNITAGGASATSFYRFQTQTATTLPHNTGKFSIFSLGGTFTVNKFSVTSKEQVGAEIMVVGDSKSVPAYLYGGYEAGYAHRLSAAYGSVVVSAGAGDRTVEVLAHIAEIIALKPKNVLLAIGSNDIRTGVAGYITNYHSITSQLQAAGINVIHLLPFPENTSGAGVDVTPLVNDIITTYTTSYIDTNTDLKSNLAAYILSDDVHTNDDANYLIASKIISSGLLTNVSYRPLSVKNTFGSGRNNDWIKFVTSSTTAMYLYSSFTGRNFLLSSDQYGNVKKDLQIDCGANLYGFQGGSNTWNIISGVASFNGNGTHNIGNGNGALQYYSAWLASDNVLAGALMGTAGGNFVIVPNVSTNGTLQLAYYDTVTGRTPAIQYSSGGASTVNVQIAPIAGKVVVGGTTPATSAKLDIQSTTSGLLLPRMTKTQRNAISTPVAGLMVYQTDNTPGLRTYNGTNWMRYTETID